VRAGLLLGCLCAWGAGGAAQIAAQGSVLPEHPERIALPPLRPFLPPEPLRIPLAGGAQLLLLESRELPLVDGLLIFRGGRLEETADQAGLLDLLADALREGGSERTDGGSLDAWLDSHAATIAVRAELDALRIEFSCVQADLGQVLEFIGELIALPAYPEAQLEGGRTRLLTQIARRDENPDELARHLLDRVVYGEDSPLARRPERRVVEGLGREALLAHHRRLLGPDRLLVGVTGAVGPDELSARLNSMLSTLKPVGPPISPGPTVFRRPSRRRIYLYDRPGAPQAEIRLAAPGTRRLQPDYVPLYLWSFAIGAGGTSNRMMVRLRTELGLIYQGGLLFSPGWGRAGRLIGSCSTRAEATDQVVASLLEILKEGRAPLPEAEFKAVRRRVSNAGVFEVDRPEKVLARALDLELHGYPGDFWVRRAERLRSLTAEEIAQAVARYVDVDRLVLVVVGPADLLAERLAAHGEVIRLAPL
jgi:zinc protease